MPDWHVLVTFCLSVATFAAGFILRAYNVGQSAGAHLGRVSQVENDVRDLKAEVGAISKRDEVQSASNAATAALLREQFRDFQTEALKTFATKTELERHERTTEAAYERLDRKMDDLGQQIRSLPGEIVGLVRGAGG